VAEETAAAGVAARFADLAAQFTTCEL
jgi:hypothetical protein